MHCKYQLIVIIFYTEKYIFEGMENIKIATLQTLRKK